MGKMKILLTLCILCYVDGMIYPALEEINNLLIKENLKVHLVGHWKMDEENEKHVDDASGNELHGQATKEVATARGKFTRSRYFDGKGYITIPNDPKIHFGTNGFTFSGWIKILDYKYPLTTLAISQAFGCYFQPGRLGFTPGWTIGHVFRANGTFVCIRDHLQNKVRDVLKHDKKYSQNNLLGKWTHYTVIFDRQFSRKIFLYINGEKQEFSLDISKVIGNIDNQNTLTFGYIHGWTTKGYIDEYRLYNKALNGQEVMAIYKDH